MIDTHSHIYSEEFDTDRDQALQRAWDAGIELLLLPDIDSESRDRMLSLAAQHPERCKAMAGLHPTSVNDNPRWREELDAVERLLNEPPTHFVGVGEIGLDLYWSSDYYKKQREVLHAQIELALEHNLPVAIHTRSAYRQMEDAIATYRGRSLRGVFHAYADNIDTYQHLAKMGDFVFGIGGVVTFKNSGLDKIVEQMPLERLILETDCPYLTPVPHRGKRNEPAYVEHVCRKVAELHHTTPQEVERITDHTAKLIFGI